MGQELVQHHKLGSGYIHKVTNWRFQDTASRMDPANQFVALDVDKMCYDLEAGSYYILVSVDPGSGVPTWYEFPDNIAAGEANTISSVGGGVSLVAGKVGVDLQVKSLEQGDNIVITLDGEKVRIDAVVPDPANLDLTIVGRIAGEAIGGHRLVYQIDDTKVGYLNPNDYTKVRKFLGISTSAAAEDTPIEIKTSGVIVEPSWTWTPDVEIWAYGTGQLTQTLPTSGYMLSIGMALTATSIQLNFSTIVQLI